MFKLSKETERALNDASDVLSAVAGIACIALVLSVAAIVIAVRNHG
jgi:hypothetical protein